MRSLDVVSSGCHNMGKIINRLAILEIVLFDKLSNKQRATGGVVNVFK